ncbi:type II toxin-antitoxin system HicB family antitoxin [Succinivibrio dextrinosolvens]|uniref:type II toxin-antitoxin system HicB family antitoxin n=1 Tax=Succinivibrio dextrinosolvens TaxID=83771 RepID=UPI00241D192C|nr:helix-turn-helix domain-containing protein [Succinivibrio dextrinosolvens]MBE6422809.1 hypothetical protein [Succinivibrio dextrinosolvens]
MDINKFKFYPVKIIENPDKTFTIQTRNWEGAFSEANTLENAQEKAKDLVMDVINSLFDDNKLIPGAVTAQEDDFVVELPLDAALKIALKNIMIEERYRKADLAKGLGIAPQRISTFLNLKKTTNLSFLEKAFVYMKRPLSISA